MAGLQIQLLGPVTMIRDSQVLTFDTRKAVALLAVLAVTDRAWARDELAAMLWPESDSVRARGSLRRTLVSAGAVGDALVVQRDRVQLEHRSLTCDVREFVHLVAKSDRSSDVRATDIYRDDFLAGFSLRDSPPFEEWLTTTRDSLRSQFDAALSRMIEADFTTGDIKAAMTSARKRVQLDPLHESAHRQLMRALAQAGQRSDALRQYRDCVAYLERELGVAPLPETAALADAIRRGSYPKSTRRPPSAVSAPTPGQPVDAAPQLPQDVFVGRTTELQALTLAMSDAQRQSQVVAITGEPGIGKTALVERFIQQHGVSTVIRVKGHRAEQRRAFGAAADLVSSGLAHFDDEAAVVERFGLQPLIPVVPRGDSVSPDLDSPAAVTRMFESIKRLLQEVAARPVLLWCDDIEWFDRESLDLVTYLLIRPPVGTLLVVSWSQWGTPHGIVDTLAERTTANNYRRLMLGPLTPDEIVELAAELGAQDADDVRSELHWRTAGIPLLVNEVVTASLDQPQVGASERTARISELVGARIDAAGEVTQQTLAALAVLGTPAPLDLLQSVSGRSEDELAEAVDDAVRRRLLVYDDRQNTYDFPHRALRAAAEFRTSAARQRLLHARAADALQAANTRRPESAAAGQIARHLQLGGRSEQACEQYQLAGLQASRLFAHETALAHWESALALGSPPAATHLAMADSRMTLGQYAAAVTDLETAAAMAASPREAVDAEHGLARVFDRLGDWERAIDHLHEASAVAEQFGLDDQQPGIIADSALVLLRLGETGDATAAAERAAALAVAADDGAAAAQANNVLGVLMMRAGRISEADTHFLVAKEYAQTLNDVGALVAVLNNHARLFDEQGDLGQAVAVANEALRHGERHGDRHRLGALHANLADLLHRAGDDVAAREHQLTSARLLADIDSAGERHPEIWKLVEW